MTAATDLARMVPGFEFLQGLLNNAGAGVPNFGAWVAPTLNPQELEKKIQELKTVHFWLEQNAKLLATTIQAMEVQRMTLSTLQSMNVPLADLSEALKIKMPVFGAAAAAKAAPQAEPEDEPEDGPEDEPEKAAPARKAAPRKTTAADRSPASATPAVDPMQWWGALTQQFTELATKAAKESAFDGAFDGVKSLAGAMVKGSLNTAGGALKKAADMPAKVASRAAAPRKRAASTAAKRGTR